MALQALMDLSVDDSALRARLSPVVTEFIEHGTPAMKARARKLMQKLVDKNKQQQRP